MKRRIATIAATAALVIGATVATTASARDSFSIAIGVPGFAVGYATPRYYAPPVVYAPPVTYYDAPVVYAAPVYYGPRYVYARPYVYYRHHHHYWYR